jgi:uncharacterized caspase-like protein
MGGDRRTICGESSRGARLGTAVGIALMLALMLVTPWRVQAAESRLAVLIGNQGYNDKVGRLKNAHHDVALVDAALRKVGFKTTLIRDAGYKAIDTELRRHIRDLRQAGKGAIGFVYYSGHGAADPDTQINYLIPVDVPSADDAELWTNSLELGEIVTRLRDQSPDATHFVVFDACRDELQLTRSGKKALGLEKGFVPVGSVSGVMIAYATAPGSTASDAGAGGGHYANVLAEEIVRPGIEAVTMFRNVHLRVQQAIGQDPWLSFPTLPAVYFAGSQLPTASGREAELTLWLTVKDSTSPAALGSYLERYPQGEFAVIARALMDHYRRRMEAEQAAREEGYRLQEAAKKAAEVKRLEEERRAREVALAAERRRAEEAKAAAEIERLEEEQRKQLATSSEELRKALEEERIALEATKAAEAHRQAAVKAAEEAGKQAEKVAALPKFETQTGVGQFDGNWWVEWSHVSGCKGGRTSGIYTFNATNGKLWGMVDRLAGTISATGAARWSFPSGFGGGRVQCSATFRDRIGSGGCRIRDCSMKFLVRKM